MRKFAIIVAGGIGQRMGNTIPKQFLLINNKPVLMHSIEAFFNADNLTEIIIPLPEQQIPNWKDLCNKYSFQIPHKIIKGGETRFHSVKNALDEVKDSGVVAIHDGVRPIVSKKLIKQCYEVAEKKGNAVPSISISESIRYVDNKESRSVNRLFYKIIQTPQCFLTEIIKKAYEVNYSEDFTDDASVLESHGFQINLVEGEESNLKITNPLDLQIAEVFLRNK